VFFGIQPTARRSRPRGGMRKAGRHAVAAMAGSAGTETGASCWVRVLGPVRGMRIRAIAKRRLRPTRGMAAIRESPPERQFTPSVWLGESEGKFGVRVSTTLTPNIVELLILYVTTS